MAHTSFSRSSRGVAPVVALFALAACGGGSGGTETATLSASLPQLQNDIGAFATGAESFPVTARFVASNGSAGLPDTLQFEVRPANDGSGNLVISTVTGSPQEFTLVRRASGDYALATAQGALFAEGAFGRNVGAILVIQEASGVTSGGFAVIGRESVDVPSCSIPDDHIDPRRTALFMARSILRGYRDGGVAC